MFSRWHFAVEKYILMTTSSHRAKNYGSCLYIPWMGEQNASLVAEPSYASLLDFVALVFNFTERYCNFKINEKFFSEKYVIK